MDTDRPHNYVSGNNQGVVGNVHGDFHNNGAKDRIIDEQEVRIYRMFEAFMEELRGMHEYIKRQDAYIKRQDIHLKEIVKNSYLRNERNMERLDLLIEMMREDRKTSLNHIERLLAMVEKQIKNS